MASTIIPHPLGVAARNHGSRIALTFGERQWTFAQLQTTALAAARLIASALPPEPVPPLPVRRERGVGGEGHPGTRIGILSANRPGYIFAVHAAAYFGVSVVPLNWRLTPAELAQQIHDADVGLLLVDEPRMDAATRATANRPIAIVPIQHLETIVDKGEQLAPIRNPPDLCSMSTPYSPNVPPLPSQWERLPPPVEGSLGGSRSGGEGPRRDVKGTIDLAKEAVVIFTSGTTGKPKGARLTFGNLWFSAIASSRFLDQHRDDVWLATLSLHHIGGLSIPFRGLIDATHVVLLPRFDPQRTLEAIDRGATHVSLVPSMLREMIADRGESPWPDTLRCILLGGAATPQALLDSCFAHHIPVAPTYGLTESSSQATTLMPDLAPVKPGSSGLPLPATQLRITDAGRELPIGETGEIELRGPTIFAGYLGEERNVNHDGWFATGDAGYLDDEGYLYVVDRRDDLIVSGGENIYPAEIERILLTHPNVADAGVVGLPHATWGARPATAVVWTGDPATIESELRAYCRAQLAAFKVPDQFLALDELPRSASGKLLRHHLRAAFPHHAADTEHMPNPVPPRPVRRARGSGGEG